MKKATITILSIIAWIVVILLIARWIYEYTFNNYSDEFIKSEISETQPSWHYKFDGTVISDWHNPDWPKSYSLRYIDDDSITLTLSSKDFKWIEYVFQFRNYLYLNLNFSNWKLIDRNALSLKANSDLWKLDNIDILSIIKKSKVKNVSEQKIWESVLFPEEFLYNDTNKTVNVSLKDFVFWKERITKKKLKWWEIMETDCDSFIIN